MRQRINFISFYLLLPIALFLFGLFNLFQYLKAGEFGPLTLDTRSNGGSTIASTSGELLAGNTFEGRFHSNFPNLGIISVRFYNQDRDSRDTLLFRLKEDGASNWIFESRVKTDQFLPHKHFPFGFPVQPNSAGKNYVFEITSLSGATDSGIFVDYQHPVFVAKSTFKKDELIKDKNLLIYFIKEKIVNIFGDEEIRINTFFYFLPFLLYLIYLLSDGLSFQPFVFVLVAFIIYDIFFLTKSYDYLYLSILFGWGLISKRFHFESRIAGVYASVFLCFTPLMLLLNYENLAEKFAVWAYLFLCITVVQQIYELKKPNQTTLPFEDYYKNFHHITFKKDTIGFKLATALKKPFLLTTIGYFIFQIFSQLKNSLIDFSKFYPKQMPFVYILKVLLPFSILILILYKLFTQIKVTKTNSLVRLIFFTFTLSLLFKFYLDGISVFKNEPKILSISPSETSEAWTDIYIKGINFKDMPFVGRVTIDGKDQDKASLIWSDSRIIYRTNPSTTKSGKLCVITSESKNSNCVDFKYNFK